MERSLVCSNVVAVLLWSKFGSSTAANRETFGKKWFQEYLKVELEADVLVTRLLS